MLKIHLEESGRLNGMMGLDVLFVFDILEIKSGLEVEILDSHNFDQ
jgi:hypothetical protein